MHEGVRLGLGVIRSVKIVSTVETPHLHSTM